MVFPVSGWLLSPIMAAGGGDFESVLKQFPEADVHVDALAARLQNEGKRSAVKSWNDPLSVIAIRNALLRQAV